MQWKWMARATCKNIENFSNTMLSERSRHQRTCTVLLHLYEIQTGKIKLQCLRIHTKVQSFSKSTFTKYTTQNSPIISVHWILSKFVQLYNHHHNPIGKVIFHKKQESDHCKRLVATINGKEEGLYLYREEDLFHGF